MAENVIEVLQERGLIDAMTSEELRKKAKEPLKVYCGFDPTAESLHLGNMVTIMGLAWFQRFGHTPIAIIGGATGMIGDPSGKRHERKLLDEETIKQNLVGIRKNLEMILNSSDSATKPLFLNNYDWFKHFSFIEFLRDVGKNFRMGPMLAKESVRTRLNSEEGMSFTEFSYQLLQAYDYLFLFDQYGVTVQLGGSDQWGNIVAGTDLIRKLKGVETYGVTFPLLTDSEGQKLGKSEKGAIWLSKEKLSPYEFYQYFFKIRDVDVIKLLKMLTFVNLKEIKEIETAMGMPGYAPNTAQKRLGEEVTRIVHGEEALQQALQVTESAKPGSQAILDAKTLEMIANDMPSYTLQPSQVVNVSLIDVLVETGLQESNSQAKRLIRSGGAYVNNQKITQEDFLITSKDLIEGKMILLGVGKKNKILIRIN